MPRTGRMKYDNPSEGHYHVIARTIQKMYLLKEEEKRYFLTTLKKLSRVYFVKISTFSIMDNHIHLIVRMLPSEEISEQEIHRRFEIYYNEGVAAKGRREYDPFESERLRHRWGDISRFVQDLLQRFSRWYNREHGGFGHVWADRFKSVLLQSHRALMACMVYVDLNSVRAKIVAKPEEYYFCGLSHMLQGGRMSSWLDVEAIKGVLEAWGEDVSHSRQVIKRYLQQIYSVGLIQTRKDATKQMQSSEGTSHEQILSFRKRIRHFTEGIFLGDKSFCEAKFQQFRSFFRATKERSGVPIVRESSPEDVKNMLLDVCSIRRLKITP